MAINAAQVGFGAAVLAGVVLAIIGHPGPKDSRRPPSASTPASTGAPQTFVLKSVSVELPTSDITFPGGAAADAINANCLACHSAGMVLTQPNLAKAAWAGRGRQDDPRLQGADRPAQRDRDRRLSVADQGRQVKEELVMSLTVDALDHLVINVRDVEVAAAWYQRVLGMTREDFDPGPGKVRRTSMKFGRQKINLRPLSASKEEWFTADHERAGSDDLCFLTAPRRKRWPITCAPAAWRSSRGRPTSAAPEERSSRSIAATPTAA